jgi:hypothetical protein
MDKPLSVTKLKNEKQTTENIKRPAGIQLHVRLYHDDDDVVVLVLCADKCSIFYDQYCCTPTDGVIVQLTSIIVKVFFPNLCMAWFLVPNYYGRLTRGLKRIWFQWTHFLIQVIPLTDFHTTRICRSAQNPSRNPTRIWDLRDTIRFSGDTIL